MKVVLLGTAAGGGFPQWNCACRMCATARAGDPRVPARTQDCVAVSGEGSDWYLLNASPDIRTQLVSCDRLAPGPGSRQTPVRGVLLSDAELDHCLGLAVLRESSGLRVHAPPAVLHALSDHLALRPALDKYATWAWDTTPLPSGLRVTAIPLGNKRPRYAADSGAEGPWVVAYRIEDPATGGVLVYAPCLAEWTQRVEHLIDKADCVLLDGTFYLPGEMAGSVTGGASQRGMGHLPIGGADGSLRRVRWFPGTRRIYTHLNNTNPILHADSDERRETERAGAEVLPDGAEIDL